ncbi:MAG TPA: invasion associated locus B family protein [Rhizomicrobium sp.]|jgi:invasion protein IalB
MRNTIIGVAAAAAIIAILFVLSRVLPGATVTPAGQAGDQMKAQIDAAAATVKPGFLGSVNIGVWNLNCVKAQSLTPPPAPVAGGTQIRFGRCRLALPVHNAANHNSVALIAVFHPVVGADELALVLYTLPVSKPGAKVILALEQKQVIGLSVLQCQKANCVALGVLKDDVYRQVISRQHLVAVIPYASSEQRMIIPVSTVGLPQAVAAMQRAG